MAKNEERGQPEASYVRSVKVFLPDDTVVELMKSRRVLVRNFFLIYWILVRKQVYETVLKSSMFSLPQLNGRRVRTPLSIDAAGAKVITSGSYSLLDTNFGLQVKFDGVHHLEITVPGEYFNKV